MNKVELVKMMWKAWEKDGTTCRKGLMRSDL